MKLTFLGTAAAEGMPAVWCNCETCLRAKAAGGNDIRTRSQIIIDRDVLIDLPPDTYMHALKNKLDLSAVRDVFITHAHMDHCYPQELVLHGEPYAHNMVSPTLNIYGNETVIGITDAANSRELSQKVAATLKTHVLKPFDTAQICGGTVTALPAVHTKNEDCFIYAVRRDGKTALIFNDSGRLSDETHDKIAALGFKFDLISFDCTYGYYEKGIGARHMGMLDNAKEAQQFAKRGVTHGGTKFILTHFSHNGTLLHREMSRKAAELGFDVAYDGLTVEI